MPKPCGLQFISIYQQATWFLVVHICAAMKQPPENTWEVPTLACTTCWATSSLTTVRRCCPVWLFVHHQLSLDKSSCFRFVGALILETILFFGMPEFFRCFYCISLLFDSDWVSLSLAQFRYTATAGNVEVASAQPAGWADNECIINCHFLCTKQRLLRSLFNSSNLFLTLNVLGSCSPAVNTWILEGKNYNCKLVMWLTAIGTCVTCVVQTDLLKGLVAYYLLYEAAIKLSCCRIFMISQTSTIQKVLKRLLQI